MHSMLQAKPASREFQTFHWIYVNLSWTGARQKRSEHVEDHLWSLSSWSWLQSPLSRFFLLLLVLPSNKKDFGSKSYSSISLCAQSKAYKSIQRTWLNISIPHYDVYEKYQLKRQFLKVKATTHQKSILTSRSVFNKTGRDFVSCSPDLCRTSSSFHFLLSFSSRACMESTSTTSHPKAKDWEQIWWTMIMS